MNSLRFARIAAVPAFVAAVLSCPGRAEACSPPSCTDGYFAPRNATTIPANAAALVLLRERSYLDAGTPLPSLKTSGGDPIDVTLVVPKSPYEPTLLLPVAPLVPGAYSFTHHTRCSQPDETTSFDVVASSAKPTSIGSVLKKSLTNEQLSVETSSGSCFAPVQAEVMQLEYAFTEELKAFMAITQITVEVDDKPWAISEYGGVSPTGVGTSKTRSATSLFRVCSSVDKNADQGLGYLTSGLHKLTVKAHVAGETTDPAPIKLGLLLDAASCAFSFGPMGADGGDLVGEDPLGADGGKTGEGPSNLAGDDSSSSSGGGCTTAAPDAGIGAWGLGLFGFVALGLRRRRNLMRSSGR